MPKQSRPILLRPSNKAWPKCSAAPWLEEENKERILQNDSEEWSLEGDDAHQRAQTHLEDYLLGLEPDPPMDELKVYTDYVTSRHAVLGGELLVESKVQQFHNADYLGTVDAAIIHEGGIHIIDLKWGEGVAVFPEENTQLADYFRSLYESLDVTLADSDLVLITIVQPRYRGDTPIKTWSVTFRDIMDFTDLLGAKAELVYSRKGLEFHPSDETCQFCSAKPWCVAHHKWALETLPVTEEPLATISGEQLSEIYTNRKKLVKWVGQVEKFVTKSVDEGGFMARYFGYAPGKRKGNTTWTGATNRGIIRAIRKMFPDVKPEDCYKKTLLSPTQIKDTVLDPEQVEAFETSDLIYRPDPKPVIVPVSEVPTDDDVEDLLA